MSLFTKVEIEVVSVSFWPEAKYGYESSAAAHYVNLVVAKFSRKVIRHSVTTDIPAKTGSVYFAHCLVPHGKSPQRRSLNYT
jgi:hypothetical protein